MGLTCSDEDTESSCVSVFFILTKLVFNDSVNNYSTMVLCCGHWKIKFKFPFCPLVKVVTTKYTPRLFIDSLISPGNSTMNKNTISFGTSHTGLTTLNQGMRGLTGTAVPAHPGLSTWNVSPSLLWSSGQKSTYPSSPSLNATCDGLSGCALSPKFMCWNSNSEYDGIRRWAHGRS